MRGSRVKTLSGVVAMYRSEAMRALEQELGKEHPYIQLYKRSQVFKDLSQTQQTMQQAPEILNNLFGPLGNNQ